MPLVKSFLGGGSRSIKQQERLFKINYFPLSKYADLRIKSPGLGY